MKKIAIILLFSILLISCESNKNSEFIGSYKIEQKSNSNVLTTATLKINSNHKYEYSGRDFETKKTFFSNGNWNVKNDTLILKTEETKDCFFVNKSISFQCENFESDQSNIVFKMDTKPTVTIENCAPKDSSRLFTDLTNEKFYFQNKKIIYKKLQNDCENYFPQIKIEIEKMDF